MDGDEIVAVDPVAFAAALAMERTGQETVSERTECGNSIWLVHWAALNIPIEDVVCIAVVSADHVLWPLTLKIRNSCVI